MEKRIHLYVSKKHPALWLTGLLMLASVVARIIVFTQLEDAHVWRQIVWPAVAVMLFVLIDGWSLTIGTLTTSIRGLGLG